MKHKIQPGMMLDIPSLDELDNKFQERLRHELARHVPHVRYRRPVDQFTANAVSVQYVSKLQVPAGFMWEVKRLSIIGNDGTTANTAFYLNDVNPSNFVFNATTAGNFFSSEQFVMHGNDAIALSGAAFTNGLTYTITLQVKEISVNNVDTLSF
jgi:hypothetical protein